MSALEYEGCNFLRQRLVLSTISGRPIRIRNIRSHEENPGVQDFEACFIRLLSKLCDGAQITINDTGTNVMYTPGQIMGGEIVHDCPPTRSITYFLEGVVALAPFAKTPLSLVLRGGVTNDGIDISIDSFKAVTLPLLKKFGIDDIKCTVRKRGAPPLGGGEVLFSCPIVKAIKPIEMMDEGKVKRVRGVTFATKVTPQFASRMVDSARGVLNDFLPDVWIFNDTVKGGTCGLSPGYGISLVAETMKGTLKSADEMSADMDPEEVGRRCAQRLLSEIDLDGVVDSSHQCVALHFLAMSDDIKPSRIRLAKLSPASVHYLRHLRDFLGISFRFKTDANSVLCSCIGLNITNLGKRTF